MKTKYRKGKLINTVEELLPKLSAGEWVYMYARPKHPKFVRKLSVDKLATLIEQGAFFEAIEKDGSHPTGTMHYKPSPHTPHWLIDGNNIARCQVAGCPETKQYPSVAEVEDKLSKHRNYGNKL